MSVVPVIDSPRYFQVVNGGNEEMMDIVSEIFHRILTPLYGSQDKAVSQIRESKDRICHLLFEGEDPVGVLVYKTEPTDEFKEFGVEKSIEVKSLFVDNSGKNSGKGLGSTLVTKLIEEVSKLGAKHLGIHVTVSETKQESLNFFRKKGFEIVHEWKGRYIDGVTEYLLSCPERIQKASQIELDLKERSDRFWRGEENYRGVGFVPSLIQEIHKAHFNDIHALIKLSDGTIVSGSKDNSLNKWDAKGNLVKEVLEIEPTLQLNTKWITAVGTVNDAYWASGTRDGVVNLWKTDGDHAKNVTLRLPAKSSHVSKEENLDRINCFATGPNPIDPSFYVGVATSFIEYNLITNRQKTTKVHDNDWVYRIEPLSENNMLIVTGAVLDLWNKTNVGWKKASRIINEPSKKRGQRRPFISDLKISEKKECCVSTFEGVVKVVDIEQSKEIATWKEHSDKAWSVDYIDPNILVSGGDDRKLKFYDKRAKESIHTIEDHAGPVHTMLSYSENLLVAGACPINRSDAQIRFYDVRKNKYVHKTG